jgi:glutamate 5-kinase
VAVEELKFGDNDMLSARVAELLGAELLVLLTSVDGLMGPDGAVIPEVTSMEEANSCVDGSKGRFSIGGMATKLVAVGYALDAGVETVIANGRHPERLAAIAAGGGLGTRFRTGAADSAGL